MRCTIARTVAVALALVLASVWQAAGDPSVTYFDDTFNASDWDTSIVSHVGACTVTTSQVTSGGNPGYFMNVYLYMPPDPSSTPRSIWTFSTMIGAAYNPSIQGAIETVDFSENAKLLSWYPAIAHPDGQATGAAIRQGGVVFYGGYYLTPETTWTVKSFTGMTESSFHSASDPNVHPDFSSSGAPIELGFYRANSTGTSQWSAWTNVGIDNWTFTINQAGPEVPEPFSMAFLGLAFAGVVAARLRHRGKRG